MRKWIALFTIILTYYIAGMFHSRILLTAALMEGFLFCQKTVRFFYASANPFRKFLLRFWNAFL
ncbi:MAG TPA: hypothetical protein H9997_03720 [Candidatus Sellimonas avistercoris]|nr:hypothetical protein [Candidatus Sellimonas avistercoris]